MNRQLLKPVEINMKSAYITQQITHKTLHNESSYVNVLVLFLFSLKQQVLPNESAKVYSIF